MKNQSSENKLVITDEFIFYQNKLSKDPNNHFKLGLCITLLLLDFSLTVNAVNFNWDEIQKMSKLSK